MATYYNEIDPFCIAWLRELMADGVIPDGDIDDRDIRNVQPADLRGFRQCHFFAGIGGWAEALRLAGWPDARPVWTGSCPCQPFSSAGKQQGGADDRHLWPHWARLIRECRPGTIVGEQVESAIAHGWLDVVFDDLERDGYACGAACLPAASVGAPHIRQRVWFVAHAQSGRDDGPLLPSQRESLSVAVGASEFGGVADRDVARRGSWRTGRDGAHAGGPHAQSSGSGDASELADAEGAGGRAQCGEARSSTTAGLPEQERQNERGAKFSAGHVGDCRTVDGLADTEHAKRRPQREHRDDGCDGADGGRPEAHGVSGTCGEVHQLGHADATRQGRIERGNGADECTPGAASVADELGHADRTGCETRDVLAERDRPRSEHLAESGSPWADLVWLPCRDGKARPTQPGIQPLAHGVSNRVGTLRGAGNAIVPQVAAAFLAAYLDV